MDRSSRIGEAVLYALNQETYLKRYLEDGYLSIDNLAAEHAEKFCHRQTQLAVCKEQTRCPGKYDRVQHHGDSALKWTETI